MKYIIMLLALFASSVAGLASLPFGFSKEAKARSYQPFQG